MIVNSPKLSQNLCVSGSLYMFVVITRRNAIMHNLFIFYILLTVHLGTIRVNNQINALF